MGNPQIESRFNSSKLLVPLSNVFSTTSVWFARQKNHTNNNKNKNKIKMKPYRSTYVPHTLVLRINFLGYNSNSNCPPSISILSLRRLNKYGEPVIATVRARPPSGKSQQSALLLSSWSHHKFRRHVTHQTCARNISPSSRPPTTCRQTENELIRVQPKRAPWSRDYSSSVLRSSNIQSHLPSGDDDDDDDENGDDEDGDDDDDDDNDDVDVQRLVWN